MATNLSSPTHSGAAPPTELSGIVRAGAVASLAAGILGTAGFAIVIGIEAVSGDDMAGASGWATAAGWCSFLGACLLVVGVIGLAVRFSPLDSATGRKALVVLGFASAVSAGAMGTLALVVPSLAERMPEILNNPPAAVPPTFIFSGAAMGIAALVLGVVLRRAGALPGRVTAVLIAGSVLCMLPLPSRFFLLAFGVAAVLAVRTRD